MLLLCCLHPELATPRDRELWVPSVWKCHGLLVGENSAVYFMAAPWKDAQTKIVCSKW